jgi:tetratricopeptide (TPR) repeat protein
VRVLVPIVPCPACGQKNRVRAARMGEAVCGTCGATLRPKRDWFGPAAGTVVLAAVVTMASVIWLAARATAPAPERWNAEGNAHLQANEPSAAVGSFAAAVKARPDVPKYHFNLGLAYARLQHYDEASHQFEEVLRLDPSDVEASRHLSLVNSAIAHRSRPD